MDSIAYNTQLHQLFTNNIGWTSSPTTPNHISYSPTTLDGLHRLQQPITSAIHQQHWMDSIAYNTQLHQLFTNNIGWTPLPTTPNYTSYSPTTLDGLHRLQHPITSAIHQQHWTDSIACNSQSHQLFTNNIGWTPSPTTPNYISYSPTTLDGLHRLQHPITSAIHQQHWMDFIAYNTQSHQLFTNNIGRTPSPATANHISYSPATLDGLHQCNSQSHQLFTNNIAWTPSPATANRISYSPTTLDIFISYNSQSHKLFANNIEWTPSPTTANHISYSPTTLNRLHRLQQPITSAIHQQHWMDSIAYNSQLHQLFTNNVGWTPSPATANHTSYSPTTLNGLHRLQQPITSAIHHHH